ncbi:aromatic-L-amino-acid decarboxylase-like [Anneissia japonica]|uniref:aromatic-L-amino-acid decarboxylase-like n=1 Tax=Anneissia japonica TaxID=1529436 RepID=UPI001425B840|nr:aromatic-L-amino-acid decarboxylase-like [Anneissia japonica]
MPDDWKLSILIPIYKGKGSVMDCGSYRGIKLLEQGMKVLERVLEKRLRDIIKIDDMKFSFMPGNAIFIVRRMQECHHDKRKKLFMCFVDLEKAFDRIPRSVIAWALRKRMVPEGLVKYVMVTHWHCPNFHAYFSAGNSFPSILGDMLSDVIGCIGFSWIASPACTELETIMLDWLGKMIGLPDEFLAEGNSKGGGVIQSTASEATLVSLLAAKMKTIRKVLEEGPDQDQYDVLPKLIAYTSDQAHSSVERAALIASIRMRILPSDDKNALRGEALQKAISKDKTNGLIPFFSHWGS